MSGEDADAPPPLPPPPPPPPDIMPSEQETESWFEETPAEPQTTPVETSGPSAPPAASTAEEILCK